MLGVCGRSHIVARAVDSSSDLGWQEVQDVGKVGVGLELAAGGAARVVLGVVLLRPPLDIADLVLCVRALWARMNSGVGRRALWARMNSGRRRGRVQGHHELAIHGTVGAEIGGHRARADAGGVGRPSANAGDQEGEEHLEIVRRAPAQSGVGVGGTGCSEGWWESHSVPGIGCQEADGYIGAWHARGGRGGSEGRAACGLTTWCR